MVLIKESRPITAFFFCLLTLTIASMDSDFANQALDMIFENKTIKKKVRPILFGGVAFNLLLLVLVIFILFRLHVLTGILRDTKLTTV